MRSRRKSRSERAAGRRLRRQILFVVVAIGLLIGVQIAINDLTRRNWSTSADNTGDLSGPSLPEPKGTTFGAAGAPSSAPQTAGASGMDAGLRAQAAELQRRYADRLSHMSDADKRRAFEKVRALFGSEPRGLPGR